ncbi:hypothetical protein AGDE_13534 [Angomonas deanei]|uniref:Uncharacterized protein n=1 Tax=Angomonas deanei TaxID=59799 RepID=A0A7G2CD33_9TRYP|nr:hypothetical protein AGDE_13534 [Angomonas deanei]CAD2217345.1 hypothetical protein, conserved [Angomonas deanei]|eukprot:EPY22205.1 hypothetical protein AGDE_13534 [Angomonas deanei]
MSLETGVLLPTPEPEETVESGDPLKDTPIQDADEVTYEPEKEIPLLVERRLRAMEDYFVQTLKEAYEFHKPLQQKNAEDLLQFQLGVVQRAGDKVAERVLTQGQALPDWWESLLAPYEESIEEERLAREEEERAALQAAAEEQASARVQEEEDIFEEDEEEEGDSVKN